MADPRDNAICWSTGQDEVVVSLADRRLIGKVKKLAEEIGANLTVNSDGSIYCRLPIECLKLSKKHRVSLSDERRAELAERMRALAKRKKGEPGNAE